MDNKQFFLFDLDGTITDPGIGIIKSVQHALRRLGREAEAPESLRCFIGPPLHKQFMEYLCTDKDGADRAVAAFREYFTKTGIYECELYPGMAELLQLLANRGKTLVLATSKPEVFASQTLNHFGLSGLFAAVCGSELDGTRSDKAEVIEYALQAAGITSRDSAVMIGDRSHDCIGAQKTGLAFIGAAWGYGGTEELREAGAGLIAMSPVELLDKVVQRPRSRPWSAAPNLA